VFFSKIGGSKLMDKKEKKYTIQQAIPKIEYFCSYQERCHHEVKSKLYDFGLNTDEVNEVLARLVKANFLNEERFAIAFTIGKFRQKKWGLNKIIFQLKSKNVSDFCIKKALTYIVDDDYDETIAQLAEKYFKKLKSSDKIFVRQQKVIQFLMSKGYEYEKCKIGVKKFLNEQT
jgi:regulatory protein